MSANLVLLAGVVASVAVVQPSKPVRFVDSVRCSHGVYAFECPREPQGPPITLGEKRTFSCPPAALLRLPSGRVVCDSRMLER